MFNNLIESSSHTREFKRRGSFLLFTVIAYGFLFVIAGIASVYAYDAHVQQQESEIVILVSPNEFPPENEIPTREPAGTPKRPDNTENFDRRQQLMASTSQPEVTPADVSTKPNQFLAVRPQTPTVIANYDSNGAATGPLGPGSRSGVNNTPATVIIDSEPPPPTPSPTPKKILNISTVLNSKALSLPKPIYSSIARTARVSGLVTVQILIDETGKVVSAHAVSGNPMLIAESVRAAYQARFSPTIVGDTPMKVSGVITYNFVLQ